MKKLAAVLAVFALLALPLAGCASMPWGGDLARICGIIDKLPDGWVSVPFCFDRGTEIVLIPPDEIPPGWGETSMQAMIYQAGPLQTFRVKTERDRSGRQVAVDLEPK